MGEEFVALDGQGRSWLCALSAKDQASVRDRDWHSIRPLRPEVHLGLALCKGQRFESAIENLAELGLSQLTPLQTERTERKAPSATRWERWNEIACSGSALGGRLIPLKVESPITLEQFTEDSPADCPLVFGLHQGQSLASALGKRPGKLRVAIGPEGGFSPREIANLQKKALGVSLGPLNLRVETAALVFLARTLEVYEGKVQPEVDR